VPLNFREPKRHKINTGTVVREHMANRKRANTRFRIAAIYPSVNIQPLIKTPKINTLQKFELSTLVVIETD
jgi:hypothetical protein